MKNRFVMIMFGIMLICALYITVPAIKVVFQIINDKPIEETIAIEDINEYLNYDKEILLPQWEVGKVTFYNDQFTSPSVSISYENEIVIRLSKSNNSLANMTEKKIEIDGKSYTFYTDGNKNYLSDKLGISYLLSTEKESDVAMVEHFLVEMDDAT